MKSGIYKNQTGSPITENIKNNLKLPHDLQLKFENFAKTPNDNTGGAYHRLDTPGHDPILGFIFGVFSI